MQTSFDTRLQRQSDNFNKLAWFTWQPTPVGLKSSLLRNARFMQSFNLARAPTWKKGDRFARMYSLAEIKMMTQHAPVIHSDFSGHFLYTERWTRHWPPEYISVVNTRRLRSRGNTFARERLYFWSCGCNMVLLWNLMQNFEFLCQVSSLVWQMSTFARQFTSLWTSEWCKRRIVWISLEF